MATQKTASVAPATQAQNVANGAAPQVATSRATSPQLSEERVLPGLKGANGKEWNCLVDPKMGGEGGFIAFYDSPDLSKARILRNGDEIGNDRVIGKIKRTDVVIRGKSDPNDVDVISHKQLCSLVM